MDVFWQKGGRSKSTPDETFQTKTRPGQNPQAKNVRQLRQTLPVFSETKLVGIEKWIWRGVVA